jgi:streptogramin lyase
VAIAVLLMLGVIVARAPERAVAESRGATSERSPSLWVGRVGLEELTRLGLDGRRRAAIDLCCEPRAIAVADDAVWVSTDAGGVLRIDPASNEIIATIDVGGSAGTIAVGPTAVWVSVDGVDLVGIDPSTNTIARRTTVGSETAPVVDVDVGEDAVWVLLDFALELVRIDPDTGAVTGSVPLCGPQECRVGAAATSSGLAAGAVWLVDDTAHELLVIDTAELSVRERVRLGTGNWYLAAGPEGVWALVVDTGRLLRVDPDDPRDREPATDRFRGAQAFTLGAGSVWVYVGRTGQIVRIDAKSGDTRRRIEITRVRTLAVG